jgi:hypothetical protein
MAQDSKFSPTGGPPPMVVMSPEQFTTLLGHHHHGGLTEEQLTRLIAALQRRTALTPVQEATSKGIADIGQRMGLSTFAVPRPGVVRRGNAIDLTPPKGTEGVRIYYTGGVEEVRIDGGQTSLQLPACIGANDRIGRLEYLGHHKRVLAVAGPEVRVQDYQAAATTGASTGRSE